MHDAHDKAHSYFASPQGETAKIGLELEHSTTAAERQDPDFLFGPRNKKTRKKRSNLKILHPPVQITSQGF
jgi:hypothetical protein